MLVLYLFFGVIALNLVLAVVLGVTGNSRPASLPAIGSCETEIDCPSRMFCYRNIEESFISGNDSDTEILESACGCYVFFGEAGNAGIPGTNSSMYPEGGYCHSASVLKPIAFGFCAVVMLLVGFTMIQLCRTMFQLIQVDALSANASGIVLLFATLSSTFGFLLQGLYLLEIGEMVDPAYQLLDNVRPLFFGTFAVTTQAAVFSVSIMWADVLEKSKSKNGRDPNSTVRLKKRVAGLTFLTLVIVFGSLYSGNTTIAAVWIMFMMISSCIFYNRVGKKLSKLLMPADLSAPGAVSSKQSADEILKTARWIISANALFTICLVVFAICLPRPATGPAAFLAILTTFMAVNAHHVRMVEYIRFGSRKKLAKGGYGAFRASALLSSSSAVSPGLMATVSSNKSSGGRSFKSGGSFKSSQEQLEKKDRAADGEVSTIL